MPNHVTTELKASPQVLDALVNHEVPEVEVPEYIPADQREKYLREHRERVRKLAEEGYVDFALLIPEPANIEKGFCSGTHPPGVVCWYEWNVSNWGTKWNGYETDRVDDTTLRFQTAWSHPLPVIEALSAKFPDEEIEVAFADEDLGRNVGSYNITNGMTVMTSPEGWEGTDEAMDFASQLAYGKSYAELRKEWGEEDDED